MAKFVDLKYEISREGFWGFERNQNAIRPLSTARTWQSSQPLNQDRVMSYLENLRK